MEIASINYDMMQMPVGRSTAYDWKCLPLLSRGIYVLLASPTGL